MISNFKYFFSYIFILSQFSSCLSPKPADSTTSTELQSSQKVKNSENFIRSPLYISNDFGKTWGDANQGLPIDTEISFMEKMGNEIVIATDNLGIFISKNNKKEWISIGNDLPSKKINALYISGSEIFVGVFRKGIFSSNDEGKTWKNLNFNLPNLSVQAILNTNDQLIIGNDVGIFKLDNKNKNWNQLVKNTQVLSLCSLEEKLIAGTNFGTLLSLDNGETWDSIHEQGAIHYTHTLGDEIVEMYLSGDLFFSSDFGRTWTEANYQPRSGSYVYEVIEIGGNIIFSNNYGIHRSLDDGKTWDNIYNTEQFVFFDFLTIDNSIYAGTRSWNEYRKRD